MFFESVLIKDDVCVCVVECLRFWLMCDFGILILDVFRKENE